jgi:two-component system sensor histidine kinase HydH
LGRTWARRGWLATTVALAVALVAGSWLNYRAARDAVSTLNRGQADLLELAIREVVHPFAEELDSTDLRAFLDAHTEAGLRYVALLSTAGGVTLSAGEPAAPPTLPARGDSASAGGRALVAIGDRVRAYFPRPPVAAELSRDDDRSRGERGARAQGERRAPRASYYHLLEFEPVVASALVARATQSLVLAGIGAGILTLAALLFWRTSDRYAQALIRLEEQKRLTVLGEMSAVLAHEIRNPLASLKGHAQLLAEKLPAETREHARAERVIGEATRLEALTSDLLDFARAGPVELRAADPAQLARTAIADVAEDGFELDTAAAPADWPLDAPRIRQALVNVLQNARQASAEGRRPRIRVAEEEAGLIYEVRDFGPGLPAGSADRIFDPFFTTRTNGTGLGLAVARRVAELHGGRITASNHAAGGAVFRIVLPRPRVQAWRRS